MPQVSIGSYSIEAASGWSLSTVILAGPVEEQIADLGMPGGSTARPFQRNLVATMEEVPEGVTPEIYVRRQVEGLRKAGVERRQAEQPERVELAGGVNGLLTEQVITAGTGESVRQMQLVCIKQNIAYTLIASHLDGAPFRRAREEFRRMLLSFT